MKSNKRSSRKTPTNTDGPAIRTNSRRDHTAIGSITENVIDESDGSNPRSILSNECAIRTEPMNFDGQDLGSRTERDLDTFLEENVGKKKDKSIRSKLKPVAKSEVALRRPGDVKFVDKGAGTDFRLLGSRTEKSDFAIRTPPPEGSSQVSKTERVIQLQSLDKSDNAIRTANPDDKTDASKTERVIQGYDMRKNLTPHNEGTGKKYDVKPKVQIMLSSPRSKESARSGEVGIRTERPYDFSKTEKELTEEDLQFQMPADYEAEVEKQEKSSRVPKVSPPGSIRSSRREKPGSDFRSSIPDIEDVLYNFWTNRSTVEKVIFTLWLVVSTLFCVKILVTFINVYWMTNIDDCYSSSSLCKRFGIACFTRCGVTKWDIFWYKLFDD